MLLAEHCSAFISWNESLLILISSCLTYVHRPKGSDCGIVNVNIPTSGAEIGGAFGMFLTLYALYASSSFKQ